MARKKSTTRKPARKLAAAAAPTLRASLPTLQSLAEPLIDFASRRIDGNLAVAEQAWAEGVAALREKLSASPGAVIASAREVASSAAAYVRAKPWHAASLALLAGATLAASRAAAQDAAR